MTQNFIGQIDGSNEDGQDLVARLNGFDTAHKTNQAGTTRPGGIAAGGVWTRDNGDSTYTLMLYDGATDLVLASLPTGMAAGDVLYYDGSSLKRLAAGTDGQSLIYDAVSAKPKWGSAGTGESSVLSLSGNAAVDFMGIPATAREITVGFRDVSLSGSDHVLIQIGDSSIITTGYVSTGGRVQASFSGAASSENGFLVHLGDASRAASGAVVLTKEPGANQWMAFGTYHIKTTGVVGLTGGDKALVGVLSRIRFTRDGTNTFDSGSVFVSWRA